MEFIKSPDNKLVNEVFCKGSNPDIDSDSDTLNCGFNTFLIKEGYHGENLQEDDIKKVIEEKGNTYV